MCKVLGTLLDYALLPTKIFVLMGTKKERKLGMVHPFNGMSLATI